MPRKLMLAIALTSMAMLMFASVAMGQSRGPSGADGTYNCADFDSQAQAQGYYDAQGGLAGGDPDGLDEDLDGTPCESLPGGEAEDGTIMGDMSPTNDSANIGNCPPGTNPVEGGCLTEDGSVQSPDELFACEGIASQEDFEACVAEQSAETVAETPTDYQYAAPETPSSTEVAPSATVLPDTGGPVLLIAAGAALLGAGWMLRYRG